MGDLSYLQTTDEAGNLSEVAKYDNQPIYGYSLMASGSSPAPTAGIHFVFDYEPLQAGQTELMLYDKTLSNVIDSVQITVTPPKPDTSFTYQGRLMDTESPANGLYDFRFQLYDSSDPDAKTQTGPTVNLEKVNVTEGYFTVNLDFGENAFTGQKRWLQIAVTQTDSGLPMTTLNPRQPIKPTPYAISAQTVSNPFEGHL